VDVREILVSVKCGDGSGGVVRGDDGEVWLSWSVDQIGGPRVDDCRPAHLGLEDERALLGGLLPSCAVSAEAVDDRGLACRGRCRQRRPGRSCWSSRYGGRVVRC